LEFIVHEALRGDTAGDVARLVEFRDGLSFCLRPREDALFELVDALAGASQRIRSIGELMFEPASRRGWGSLYQALHHGRIDMVAARALLAGQARPVVAGRPLMFAIDVSKYPRPDTRRVADVGMQYAAGRERFGGAPVVPGWAMQWVAQVGLSPVTTRTTSWCLPVDVRRVATSDNANDLAAVQIAETTRLVRVGEPGTGVLQLVLFLLDSGYCPIYLTQHLPAGAQILVRLRGDRVFFAPPPPRSPGAVGRPTKHGARFALDEPDTWPTPDVEHTTTRPDGTTVHAQAWHRYHPEPRQRRHWEGTGIVEGTLIRQQSTTAGGHTQTWWLWWAGPADTFDLAVLADAYHHRYTIEHGFRFIKQDLFWTDHTPMSPDQAERWSWVVAFAYTQLHLARRLVANQRRPWEKPQPHDHISPRRVRRGFRHATAHLPTPANPPKPSRPGPGRPKGSKNKNPRTPQPVIKKGRPHNTGHPQGRSPLAQNRPQP
jgi:DDE superfamily endonuclease